MFPSCWGAVVIDVSPKADQEQYLSREVVTGQNDDNKGDKSTNQKKNQLIENK